MRVKEIIAFLAEVLVAAKALVRELLRWKYSSVFGGGVWFLGAGAMIGHEYIVALVAFIIGSSWLIGWWLTERKGSVYDKWLGVIVIAAITAGLCIYSYRLYRTQLLDDYEGALIPANEPAPPNICGGISGEGEVVILGTAAAYSHTFPITVLSIEGSPALILDKDSQGGLSISTTIFDQNYDWVTSIVDNKFEVDKSVRKHRKDFSELIVKIRHGDEEVLHIRYINPHVVRLSGIFRSNNHVEVKVGDAEYFIVNGHPVPMANVCLEDLSTMWDFKPPSP